MSGKPPAAPTTSNLSGFVPGQLSAPDAACAAQSKLASKRARSFITDALTSGRPCLSMPAKRVDCVYLIRDLPKVERIVKLMGGEIRALHGPAPASLLRWDRPGRQPIARRRSTARRAV